MYGERAVVCSCDRLVCLLLYMGIECFATDNLIPFVYYQAITFDCCNKTTHFQFEQTVYNLYVLYYVHV